MVGGSVPLRGTLSLGEKARCHRLTHHGHCSLVSWWSGLISKEWGPYTERVIDPGQLRRERCFDAMEQEGI